MAVNTLFFGLFLILVVNSIQSEFSPSNKLPPWIFKDRSFFHKAKNGGKVSLFRVLLI